MSSNPEELFQRYLWAGAMTHNPDALAAMYTEDGILEAPLVPADSAFPRRLAGREEIRAGVAAYYERSAGTSLKVDMARSRYTLHTTADPDVFIVEIDTAFEAPEAAPMSLVQIYRLRDGLIAHLRDYFVL
jgi:hypothetical protein